MKEIFKSSCMFLLLCTLFGLCACGGPQVGKAPIAIKGAIGADMKMKMKMKMKGVAAKEALSATGYDTIVLCADHRARRLWVEYFDQLFHQQ